MVIPAKVAAQVSKGLVKPMRSKAVASGIYDNLVDAATNVSVAKATLVPVETAAKGAATTGVAGAAVGTAAAGGAITVAAPLVLLAVAVGASAYATSGKRPSSASPNSWNNSTTTSWSMSATPSTAAATRLTRPRGYCWIAGRLARRSGWTQPCTRSAPRCRTRTVG